MFHYFSCIPHVTSFKLIHFSKVQGLKLAVFQNDSHLTSRIAHHYHTRIAEGSHRERKHAEIIRLVRLEVPEKHLGGVHTDPILKDKPWSNDAVLDGVVIHVVGPAGWGKPGEVKAILPGREGHVLGWGWLNI